MRQQRGVFLLGIAILGALGCTEVPIGGKDHDPPTFSGTTDGSVPNLPSYPKGPYGVSKGAVIQNYSFPGYINALVYNAELQTIQLADFYNPHGRDAAYAPATPEEDDRLYAKGSQYGEGTPKPTVLALILSAVWCGPCNEEAKTELPPKYARYNPCKGEFLLQLADGPTPGEPATQNHLTLWTKKYKEDFPAAIDPSYKLGGLFQSDAFPANILVDTTTMQIVEVITGVPDESYWHKYEQLLPDPSCAEE